MPSPIPAPTTSAATPTPTTRSLASPSPSPTHTTSPNPSPSPTASATPAPEPVSEAGFPMEYVYAIVGLVVAVIPCSLFCWCGRRNSASCNLFFLYFNYQEKRAGSAFLFLKKITDAASLKDNKSSLVSKKMGLCGWHLHFSGGSNPPDALWTVGALTQPVFLWFLYWKQFSS